MPHSCLQLGIYPYLSLRRCLSVVPNINGISLCLCLTLPLYFVSFYYPIRNYVLCTQEYHSATSYSQSKAIHHHKANNDIHCKNRTEQLTVPALSVTSSSLVVILQRMHGYHFSSNSVLDHTKYCTRLCFRFLAYRFFMVC